MQLPLVQSLFAWHPCPLAHVGQVPPQSTSVSLPFWMPSVHVGGAHGVPGHCAPQ